MKNMGVDVWMNAVMSALGFIACAVFVATYHLTATWWRSEVGRNQMAFVAAIGLLCLYTVLATVWQGDACILIVLRSLRTLAVAAVVVLVVQRTRLMLRAQKKDHRTGV
ncbi:putative phage holin [Streptomyces sp. NPDC001492]